MTRRAITVIMAVFFLAGGTLLPLGDFSLLREVPDMYANYLKVADPTEAGPIDFIGDYLLQGKQIFGHNANDKTPTGGAIQFQHQATALNVVFLRHPVTLFAATEVVIDHPVFQQLFRTSDFCDELLRPPLG